MDLDPILDSWPGIRSATASDNSSLLDFYERQDMNTPGLRITYERGPDFFAFLKMHATNHEVLLSENDDRSCHGVATFVLRDGYLNQGVASVGYLGDLRIGFDRKLLKNWRKLYGQLLHPDQKWHRGCQYFLTAVLLENVAANRALIRPKNADYVYEPLTPYQIVQVFMPKPMRSKSLVFKARSVRAEEKTRLYEFLNKYEKKKQFGFLPDEWNRRAKAWGVGTEDFFVVEQDGVWKGCVAPWSPSVAKRILIQQMPKIMKGAVGLWNRFGADTLPKNGEEMRALYLTHLCLDDQMNAHEQSSVFRALLEAALEKKREIGAHSVSFPVFENDSFLTEVDDFFAHKLSAQLFSVRHRETSPLFFDETEARMSRFGFEMALV